MIVRQEFNQLPPKGFLMQVMDAVSKTYCYLWEKKNKDNRVHLDWDDLKLTYNRNNFRTSLRKLGNAGLISFWESKDSVDVELVGWDEIEE